MAAGSIVVDLLLKTGSFETDTQRASKSLKKFQKDAELVGKAIGVAFTAGIVGLAALAKSSIDSADHLNDLSKKTGVSVETLGGLGFAASQAGGDLESTALGLGKLNKTIAEAAAGNKDAVEFFTKLGISVKDSNGQIKDAGKIYLEVADKFASFEDGPNKAALALRGFGKAGLDQIPVLNEGGKALAANIEYYKRYGGITTETAQKADEFKDTLGKLTLLSQAFGRTLSAEALGPLQALADLWLKNKENGDQFAGVAQSIVGFLKAIAIAGAYTAMTFTTLGDQIGGFFAQMAAFGTGDFKGGLAIGKAMDEQVKLARKSFADFVDAINSPTGRGTGGPHFSDAGFEANRKSKGPAPGLAGGGDKGKDEFGPLLKRVTEMNAEAKLLLDSEDNLTAAQKLGAKIAADYASGLLKISPAQLMVLDATLKSTDATQKAIEAKEREKAWIIEATNANADFIDQQRQIRDGFIEQAKAAKIELEAFGLDREAVDALATARMRDVAATKDHIAAIMEADGFLDDAAKAYREQAKAIRESADARDMLSQKEHALHFDALVGGTQAVKDYLKEIERAGDATYKVVSDAFKSLEDSLVQVLSGGNIKDIAKSFVNQILSEIYRLYIVKPLLASIFGSGGGLSSLVSLFDTLSSGYSIDTGGSSTNFTGGSLPTSGGRAAGGPVGAGQRYMVGERGPEVLQMGSMGGRVWANQGPNITIENHGADIQQRSEQGSSGQEQVRLIIRTAVEESRRAVAGDIASGSGLSARALKSRGVNLSGALAKRN